MGEEQAAIVIAPVVVGILFIGLPWLILHYITKWRQAKTLTSEDEGLLDDLHDTARRLEERLTTVERLVAADNPDWRPAVRSDDDLARIAALRVDARADAGSAATDASLRRNLP